MTRTGTLLRLTGCGLALTLALGGCGSDQPLDTLDARLAAVDTAVLAGDDAATSDALDALVLEASELGDAGDLTAAQVRDIDDAADELRAALPAETPSGTTSPTQEPSVTPSEETTPDAPTTSSTPDIDPPKTPKPPKKDKGPKRKPGKGKDKGPKKK